jgi:beta-glucosidase
VIRILRQKIRFAQIGEPGRYGEHQVASESHRALAREVAQKGIVLLKNEPPQRGESRLLPLNAGRLGRLAVIGRLAAEPNIGDSGSSRVRPRHIVTPLEGIRAALEGNMALIQETSGKPQAAADAARAADAAIVVVGYTAKDEGEHLNMFGYKTGGDRVSLYLSPEDEALIQAAASVNPRTIVVLMGSGAIIMERWSDRVPAILMAWYPGMEGGHALVDILFGAVNPSGKLPCVFPRSANHLPPFDSKAEAVDYGYWHGYRLLDRDNHEPAFVFGHGLSFTTFEYANLALSAETVALGGSITASVDVTNTGDRSGDEVVQLYIAYPETAMERPVRELKSFARVPLASGETRRVALTVPARRLAYWDEDRNRWWVETVRHTLCVGPSSRASDLLTADFRVTDE